MLEKQSQVMAHTALGETGFLVNLNDSCLSPLQGLDDLGSRCQPSVDVSHSGDVGSWMVGRRHACSPFLGEISHQEFCLCLVFLSWFERLVQFNFDQVESLSVVFTDIVPFDHVKGNLEIFLDARFEYGRSQLASAFHADSFQGCSAWFPIAL